jgi:hypothetical protein
MKAFNEIIRPDPLLMATERGRVIAKLWLCVTRSEFIVKTGKERGRLLTMQEYIEANENRPMESQSCFLKAGKSRFFKMPDAHQKIPEWFHFLMLDDGPVIDRITNYLGEKMTKDVKFLAHFISLSAEQAIDLVASYTIEDYRFSGDKADYKQTFKTMKSLDDSTKTLKDTSDDEALLDVLGKIGLS